MRAIFGFVVASLAGCASLAIVRYVDDGDERDPAMAYVLVSASSTLNGQRQSAMAGVLVRIDRDGSTHEMSFTIPTGRPQILALPPGVYYVSDVIGGPLGFKFDRAQSLFYASPGRINYAGDWIFVSQVASSGHPNDREYQYRDGFRAVDRPEPEVGAQFAQRYPRWSAALPLVHTLVRAH